jgi:hypothetical protein
MCQNRKISLRLLIQSYGGRSTLKKTRWAQFKFHKNYWLLGRNSELLIHNKIILYKQVIHPVWSYCIQLWDCASDSNIDVIPLYQKKLLICIINVKIYPPKNDLHCDLGVETFRDFSAKFADSHE